MRASYATGSRRRASRCLDPSRSAPVDDARLEAALEYAELFLELFGIEALGFRVRRDLAQREPEAQAGERLYREPLKASRAEIGDECAGLVQQDDPLGVTGLERVEELRQSAAADRGPALGPDGAEAEEVRGAVGVPERAVLDRISARAEDAAQSLTPRGCAVVCEIPRLPKLSAVGHRGAHYQPTGLTESSTIRQMQKGEDVHGD